MSKNLISQNALLVFIFHFYLSDVLSIFLWRSWNGTKWILQSAYLVPTFCVILFILLLSLLILGYCVFNWSKHLHEMACLTVRKIVLPTLTTLMLFEHFIGSSRPYRLVLIWTNQIMKLVCKRVSYLRRRYWA